ncbi:glycosyltransferase family 4 protein [Acidianus sp. RZ1]|uniref:glycosyltransferase family 4 protein n=1 Tax=Acidianus sp. RZ1 TaxID=1540082 RepID=UPI001491188F|nr:glycosyltransferase [Acidianus sp. RZ1]NON62836.1 glycosyltransferase [Acidianus sp. RZ1]
MIKLGIVYDQFLYPWFGGGGAVHAFEVVKRLAKDFSVIYFPSTQVFNVPSDTLIKKAKELETYGIKISDEFYEMNEKNMKANPKSILEKYKLDVDFLYEPDHRSPDIFYLGKRLGKFGLTIHEPLFYKDSLNYLRRLVKFYKVTPSGKGFYTRFLYNELVAKPRYRKLLRKFPPTFIASVSQGSLEESGVQGEVIIPGNAFDPSLLKYRNKGKEDYIVFWSRLNQDKGLPEIPDILRILKGLGVNTRLILAGKFFNKYYETLFWKKVKKYNLNVEYLGFVEREKLNDVVSRSKALIYPSHVDGFSLVMLEALALGTPVVAYSIPAIRSIYKDLKAVKLVEEFNKVEMAKKLADILRLSEKEIEEEMNDNTLLNFLELHSSWDNVERSVKEIILKHLEK